MSRMGDELEKRLDQNKYELYRVCQSTKDRLKACLAPNPEIDSAETHVDYLHGIFTSCISELDKVLGEIHDG